MVGSFASVVDGRFGRFFARFVDFYAEAGGLDLRQPNFFQYSPANDRLNMK
jgi:hypothetical protein